MHIRVAQQLQDRAVRELRRALGNVGCVFHARRQRIQIVGRAVRLCHGVGDREDLTARVHRHRTGCVAVFHGVLILCKACNAADNFARFQRAERVAVLDPAAAGSSDDAAYNSILG